MLRKGLIALVAAAAMAVAFIPTESSARGFGGHGGHGFGGHGFGGHGFGGHGFGGRGFVGRGFGGRGFHRGFRGRGFIGGFGLGYGLGYYPYYDYPYDGCWRLHRVLTPWGWRWRRHYVCY